jgi:hypothetical protein
LTLDASIDTDASNEEFGVNFPSLISHHQNEAKGEIFQWPNTSKAPSGPTQNAQHFAQRKANRQIAACSPTTTKNQLQQKSIFREDAIELPSAIEANRTTHHHL